MNLLFNKNLMDNAAKVFDIYLRPTHRASETTIKVYTDAMNSSATALVPAGHVLFASAGFLVILDKISNAFWSESFDVANIDQVKLLLNTILHGTETQRNSALDKLVSMGIVASGDTTSTRSLASRIPTFDPALMVRSYDSAENFFKYTYNIPLGLEKKYDAVRNTSTEKLYLVFVGRGHSNFGYAPAVGETFGHTTKYWNELFSKESLAVPYMAVDLGDMTSPDETAIKYDHLDVIEYFDNILVQLAVTNLYN